MNRLVFTFITVLVLVLALMATARATTGTPTTAAASTDDPSANVCGGSCGPVDPANPTVKVGAAAVADVAAASADVTRVLTEEEERAEKQRKERQKERDEEIKNGQRYCDNDANGRSIYDEERGKCLVEKIKRLVKETEQITKRTKKKGRNDDLDRDFEESYDEIEEALGDLETTYIDLITGAGDRDSLRTRYGSDRYRSTSGGRYSRRGRSSDYDRNDRYGDRARNKDVRKLERLIESLAKPSVKDMYVRARAREMILNGKYQLFKDHEDRVKKLYAEAVEAKNSGDRQRLNEISRELLNEGQGYFDARENALKSLDRYDQYKRALGGDENRSLITNMESLEKARGEDSSPQEYARKVLAMMNNPNVTQPRNSDGTAASPSGSLFPDYDTEFRPRSQSQNSTDPRRPSDGWGTTGGGTSFPPRMPDPVRLNLSPLDTVLQANGPGSNFDLGNPNTRLTNSDLLRTNVAAFNAAPQAQPNLVNNNTLLTGFAR